MISISLCYTLYVCLEKGDIMRKFILGIKITVAVIVLLSITTFSMLSYASSKTENEYKSALDNMQRGNYPEALRIAEAIPHYKDSSELYVYLYPHKLFTDQYNNVTEKTDGYKRAIAYIEANREFLKGKNEDKYTNDLTELEKVLNFKIEEMGVQLADEASKNALNEAVNLIKQGDLPNAIVKLNTIDEKLQYAVDKHQLINYINLVNAVNANDDKAIKASIELLNPNYAGALAEDIKTLALSKVSVDKWNSMYSSKNADVVQTQPVTIGMKKDALIQLVGNAASSELIANKYGNFEKMDFESNMVYLENDTVTAVK